MCVCFCFACVRSGRQPLGQRVCVAPCVAYILIKENQSWGTDSLHPSAYFLQVCVCVCVFQGCIQGQRQKENQLGTQEVCGLKQALENGLQIEKGSPGSTRQPHPRQFTLQWKRGSMKASKEFHLTWQRVVCTFSILRFPFSTFYSVSWLTLPHLLDLNQTDIATTPVGQSNCFLPPGLDQKHVQPGSMSSLANPLQASIKTSMFFRCSLLQVTLLSLWTFLCGS